MLVSLWASEGKNEKGVLNNFEHPWCITKPVEGCQFEEVAVCRSFFQHSLHVCITVFNPSNRVENSVEAFLWTIDRVSAPASWW